ncbi:MAG TPA: 50S ribosomal protein L32 [Chlamydiales bacterium]|nr:50S ribosomal protein L32 [Chlamydiales bacterium]
MAVPRNRHSNARKNKRRSHMAKTATQLIACSNCSAKILPHRICPSCGYYAKRPVVQTQEQE